MYCEFGCLILCELEHLGLVAELFGRSLADPDVLDPRRSMSAPLHVSRPTLAGTHKGISISTAKLPRTLERKLTTTGTGYQVIDCVKKRDGKVILHGASHWDIYATARQFSSCCYARRDNSDLRIDPPDAESSLQAKPHRATGHEIMGRKGAACALVFWKRNRRVQTSKCACKERPTSWLRLDIPFSRS